MAQRRRSRIGKTGCLFWLFILLVIIVVFVYKGKGNLKESFKFVKNNPISEALKKSEKDTEKETQKNKAQNETSVVKKAPQKEEPAEVYVEQTPGKDEEQSQTNVRNTSDRETMRTAKAEPDTKLSEIKKSGAEKDRLTPMWISRDGEGGIRPRRV